MRSDRRPGPTTRVRVTEVVDAKATQHEDRLATEEPMEIRIGWPGHVAERWVVTMRTPGHDFELATGLGFAEGLWVADDVAAVGYCTDRALRPEERYNVVTVTLQRPPRRDPGHRHDIGSACGVCGKDSLDQVTAFGATPQPIGRTYDPAQLSALPDRLRDEQRVFARTGGLHAAGLFRPDGTLVVSREDVGRHNAVDKAVGHALTNDTPLDDAVLCVSGRLGFEIVQKAAVAGLPVVVAVGAPSSLAVELAKQYGITAVGFARGRRLVVYSHPARLSGSVGSGN